MKKEKLFWVLTAVAAVVSALTPYVGSGFFGILSLPFTALGWLLRTLSLSGAAGNAASIALYGLVCLAPVFFWMRSKRRTEDRILLLLTPVLAVVLYYMVNPNLRHYVMRNHVGDAIYASSVWSTLMTWGVLKLLYGEEWGIERNIYKGLRIFLLLCSASCLIECFGNGTAQLVHTLRSQIQIMGQVNYGVMDIVFMALAFLVNALENGLAALVLYKGAKLLEELERDPFGAGCVEAAHAVSKTCRNGLGIICLTCLLLNLAQILLTPILHNISASLTVPVMGLAVCFAMLAVTKLLVRGKALKDESDLFV